MTAPQRVLIVDETLRWGGSIVSTANLVRALDRSLFDPIFVTATSRELVALHLREAAPTTRIAVASPFMFYERLERVAVWARRLRPSFLRTGAEFGVYLIRHLGNLPYTLKLAWLILRERIDVVQLNSGTWQDEAALAALILRRPTVAFLRGYTPMTRAQRHVLVPRIRRIVAVSQYIADCAERDGIDRSLITVATPPAMLDDTTAAAIAEARARHHLQPDDLVFAVFGRITPWKGQREFLQAAALVLRALPRARALIVGDASEEDAEYRSQLDAIVSQHGMRDRVVFAGYRTDVQTYYQLARVAVHCSVQPEPSGRVIFEAMSSGVPVVVSSLGGPKEFIEHGVDGFVADPTDAHALASFVVKLLTDDLLHREMAERARDKVQRHYGGPAYARTIEAVYRAALDAPTPSGSPAKRG